MEHRIEEIRYELNKKLNSQDVDHDEILKISRILDEYIIEYYKRRGIKPSSFNNQKK